MGTIDLTEADRTMLERLAAEQATAEALAADVDRSPDAIEERLVHLADNGLVRDAGDDTYALTRSGRRVLLSSSDEYEDEEIDVPAGVERSISALALRPDAEKAVRNAFSFLQKWDEATASEIKDGVFSEKSAGMDDPDEWWDDLIRDALASLPGVEPPENGGRWRYEGDVDFDEPTRDGRRVHDAGAERRYGSAKHAIDRLAEGGARADALSNAFALVRERGRVTDDELARAVGDEIGEQFAADFARIPGVRRVDGDAWQYDREQMPTEQTGSNASDEEGDGCPICGQPYSGRVAIATDGTVLSAHPIKRCVEAVSTDDADEASLAVYYHQDGGDRE